MEPFKYHVFICNQQKPEGVPCCLARGATGIIEALRNGVAAAGLQDQVQITLCGSLGLCETGPNMIVYPGGTWYGGLTVQDIPEIIQLHFHQGQVVERLARHDPQALRTEILDNRDKMLAALRAKEAAGALPEELLLGIRGFQESRVMLTAIELDLFTAVHTGTDAAGVACRLGTDPRATEMLLNALAAMGLLAKANGVFSNTPVGRRYLAAGSPDDARAALTHTLHLWDRWSTLTACVRAGTAVTHQEIEVRGDDWTRPFIAAMHRIASERAPLVLRALGAAGVSRLLDIGGGSGALSIAFAKANPTLQAEVLDLPAVTEIARGIIEQAGLVDRVTTRTGDLRRDSFGEGYDLVLISQICHMLSPEENRDLLRRSLAALAPQGRVAVHDFILEPEKTAPKSAALFALNMLVGTAAGSSYSVDEYTDWLEAAGFRNVMRLKLPGPSGLIVGTKQCFIP